MPSDRTTVTELGTGLGMLGFGDIDDALRSRSPIMHSVSPEMWQHMALLRAGGAYDAEFHAAWENGRAFLAASDGLRGRLPEVIEWKGTGRAPGDEVAPIDLRVDHVYLVSCKYLSKILFNVSPAAVFDHLLLAGQSRGARGAGDAPPGASDWYAETAPAEFQALYEVVRAAAAEGHGGALTRTPTTRRLGAVPTGGSAGATALPGLEVSPGVAEGRAPSWTNGSGHSMPETLEGLPSRAVELTSAQRDALGRWLRDGWPPGAKDLYVALSDAVALASVRRWEAAMAASRGNGEAMLWRLLRIGSAPYFVLGSVAERSLRLRIATSWDWRQQYQLRSVEMVAQHGGQPRVGWRALVRERSSREVTEVNGHIEVRWSHGRFGGLPEAKGYLDTPHHLVPGYVALQ